MTRRYRLVFAAFMAVLTFYVGTYWAVRQSHTVLHIECESCPADGWEEVNFPIEGIFIVYAPLYQLDKLSHRQAQFRVIRTG